MSSKTDDLLNPYPEDDLLNPYPSHHGKDGDNIKLPTHSITSPSGTVFINNTSYSGTDITVYVHVYDPANASLLKYKALQNELKQIAKHKEEARSEISRLQTQIEQTHTGTRENDKYKNQLNGQVDRNRSLDQTIDAIQNEIKQAETGVAAGAVKALAELQTLSISTHRDKRDVRALGHVGPKGRSRGPRSIAGSMIFTVFNKDPLYDLLHMHATEFDGAKYTTTTLDQIPPVDLTIVFANEYGHVSRMALFGVDFATEGQVMSIQDIITEKTVSFFAYDFDPMRSVVQRRIDDNYKLHNEWIGKSASQLLFEEDFINTKMELDPYFRFTARQNPFI